MQQYQQLGLQIKLKRAAAGLHQKTLARLIGCSTQPLVSWWESGGYTPGDHHLRRINCFLALDPAAVRVFVTASGLQPPRKNARRI